MVTGSYFSVPFPLGNIIVHLGPGDRVTAIEFDLEGACEEKAAATSLGVDLTRYFKGNQVVWSASLDMTGLSDFDLRVYDRVSRIPYGKTATYGEIAAEAGCRGGARAVGQAMARNRFPLVIPCHRVLAANGSIGGFSSGIPLKRYLLRLEGVAI